MPTTKINSTKINYNNISRKARIMILQPELNKCMNNQPFEVNYQLPKKKKVTLEDIMNRLDNIDSRLDNIESRLDKVEDVLDQHSKAITGIQDILTRNNLK
jgi:archaellum component FlaC